MLSNRKGTASVLATGIVALSMVAAAGATTTASVGTASSSLDAVTLRVTGLDVPTVTLLQAGTFATTDATNPDNAAGAPWASALIAPVLVDGVAQGAHKATSDQAASGSSEAVDIAGLVAMSPVTVAATASADSARATIGAAEGSLSVIADLLGLKISSAGVDSIVTADGASNTQGLAVSGLDVTLGDLVPAELLAALPIDVLLSLLNSLPLKAPDLQAVADAVTKLVADVQVGVEGIVFTSASVVDGVAALENAISELASQEAIVDGLEVDHAAAVAALANLQTNVTNAAAAAAGVAGSVAGLACVTNNPLDPAAAAACLAALQATADAALAAAQSAASAGTATVDQLADDLAAASSLVGPLASAVDILTDIVDTLVAQLVSLLNNLLAALSDLVGALTNLNTSLGDVVQGLLDTTLLGLGNLELTMSAVATDSVDTSSAGINCDLSGLVVAGVELGGGGCVGDTLTGSLSGAVASLNTVLGALPVVGNLVPTVSVDLMQMTSSVTESEGVVTATSTVVPLVIDLPSIAIDPASIVDGLLADLTGILDGVLASLPTSGLLSGVGLDAAAAQIAGLTGQQVPDLLNVEGLLNSVVALMPNGSGLVAMTTPGFNLMIDPTSTASFAPGGSTAAAPAPAPSPDPLPATGGGLAALAILGMGGAASLRRRR